MTFLAKLLLLGVAFLLLLSVFPVTAQMRCETELISEGDSELRVLAACGEPMQREPLLDQPLIDERWIYNFGPDELLRIVSFRNGLVERIDVGDNYGFAPDF